MIIDLFLLNGPISKIFETFQNEELVSPAELAAREGIVATVTVSYTHLTLPTNREV